MKTIGNTPLLHNKHDRLYMRLGLSMVVCKTPIAGLHCYLYLSQWWPYLAPTADREQYIKTVTLILYISSLNSFKILSLIQ